jgi:prokaryotic ubiquitin-like protein Pup
MTSRDTGGQRQSTRRPEAEDDVDAVDAPEASVTERHEALSEDVDAILDEIDEVLEENAEDFVRAFVQKGGQ